MNDPLLSELRGMLIFVRVIENGSFTGAANRLGVSRAVISYQVKQQEQRLGVRLLNRSTRKISLTAAGQLYFEHCQVITKEAEKAHRLINNLKDEAVGRVSLAAPVNLGMQWIVPVANAFRFRYPNIDLDINFSETLTNLIQEGIDIAVRAGPLLDSELKSIKLGSITRHICAAPSYFRSKNIPTTLDQVKDYDWIVYSRLSNKLSVTKNKIKYELPISGSLHTNNAAARLQFTLSGQGLAVLPLYDIQDAIEKGDLIELLPDYSIPNLDIYAVFPAGSTQARASRLMLDMLRQYPPDKVAALK